MHTVVNFLNIFVIFVFFFVNKKNILIDNIIT